MPLSAIQEVNRERMSDVIVKNRTLIGEPLSANKFHETIDAVKNLARELDVTNREAAVIIAQSFGIVCHFS